MSVLNMARRIANRILAPAGVELVRSNPLARTRMEEGLQRAAQHGFGIRTIVDVGAAEGAWAEYASRAFPDAHVILVEALEERRHVLESKARQRSGKWFTHIGAAGRARGQLEYRISEDLDGSGMVLEGTPHTDTCRTIPVLPLDEIVAKSPVQPPYLLKLDTHGFEIPILEGAAGLLAETSVLIIECYALDGGPVPFWEMCRWLGDRGWRCFDLVDPSLRPKDHLLWQMDLFFARTDWPPFRREGYT